METNTIYYIAYGSNISKKQMAVRCPGATPVDIQILKGYRLDSHQYLTIEKDPNYSTPVVIWKINRENEKTLDKREGVHSGIYRKEYLSLLIDGNEQKCLVYIMNDLPWRRNVLPSKEYLDTCLDGYRDFDLDTNILLESFERVNKKHQ